MEEIRWFIRWMEVWIGWVRLGGREVEWCEVDMLMCAGGRGSQQDAKSAADSSLLTLASALALTRTLPRTTLTLTHLTRTFNLFSTDIHTYNEWIISIFTCIQQLDSLPPIISTHVPIITMNECKKEWFKSNEWIWRIEMYRYLECYPNILKATLFSWLYPYTMTILFT